MRGESTLLHTLFVNLQARKHKVRVDAFHDLSDAQQESVLQMPAMEYLTIDDQALLRGFFELQGDAQLVFKVNCCILEAKHSL